MTRSLKGALDAARSVVRRRGALVLVYHRVGHAAVDPWSLTVSPRHLAEHLDLLARALRPVPARAVVAALVRGDRLDGTAAVTFDDGYADLLEHVRPRLERSGISATAFVVSGAVGSGREFWWDALQRILLETTELPRELELSIAGVWRRWHVPPFEASDGWRAWNAPQHGRQALYLELWTELSGLPAPAREALVDQLASWADVGETARPSYRPLEPAELAALARHTLVDIGAHSVTHPVLALLGPGDQRAELVDCRAALRAMGPRDVPLCSYPYGGAEHVTPETVQAAASAGFEGAFMNVSGLVGGRTDRFRIPRVFVEDGDADALARTLRASLGLRLRS